jgi:hypothetical protein
VRGRLSQSKQEAGQSESEPLMSVPAAGASSLQSVTTVPSGIQSLSHVVPFYSDPISHMTVWGDLEQISHLQKV